jgi:hypothetical protein
MLLRNAPIQSRRKFRKAKAFRKPGRREPASGGGAGPLVAILVRA